jgi:hypothetical protein
MTDDAKLPEAFYFLVGDPNSGVYSYCWRLGSGATSFYIKPRYAALTLFKVSLHGPDDRPGLMPGFKVAIDQSAEAKVRGAGGALVVKDQWPDRQWYSGRPLARGVSHVMRIRTTWDLLSKGVPSAPIPAKLKKGNVGGLIAPPRSLHAVDVDVYVSDRFPFWPKEDRARRDNACMGPIQNRAGQFLTAVSFDHSVIDHPTPARAVGVRPASVEDRTRGFGAAFDPEGYLWVCEQWLSRSALIAEGGMVGGANDR